MSVPHTVCSTFVWCGQHVSGYFLGVPILQKQGPLVHYHNSSVYFLVLARQESVSPFPPAGKELWVEQECLSRLSVAGGVMNGTWYIRGRAFPVGTQRAGHLTEQSTSRGFLLELCF